LNAARGIRPLRFAALLALAALCTAGAPAARRSAGGSVPGGHPRVALLPFENLAGREEQSQLFTRVFFAHLVASDAFAMVEPAEVDAAMDSLGIRSAAAMTPAGLRALADTLHASYLLLGSVLESGIIQSGGGAVPAVGATLRLVEPATGRVAWAGVHFRSGEDRETVFGWGRVMSTERMVSELASDLLKDFREAGARWARSLPTERR
jgi:TolB-like protein